jgi:hypothetical protein
MNDNDEEKPHRIDQDMTLPKNLPFFLYKVC